MKQQLDPRTVPYGTIEGWLWHLGLLCAGSMPAEEAAMRIAEFADMLRPRVSAGSLSHDSCGYVAERCTFFPSFGEVAKHLAEWCRDHAPREHRHTTPLPSLPPAERCTPEQAAEIIARHGIDAPRDPPGPVRPAYLTGDALEAVRASTPLVAAAREAQRRAKEAHP